MTNSQPTKILILGGGFGGVYTAITLEKLLKRGSVVIERHELMRT